MSKFNLKEHIAKNKSTFFSTLTEDMGLTPLQDYIYQYEIEVSGEDNAQDYLNDIKQLNTPQDVYDYYAYERGWKGSDLDNIFRQVKRKFASSNTADELTPLQKQAYSYAKERFGFEDAKNSLDQIKTLTTRDEFWDWVKKKIEAEESLNEDMDETELPALDMNQMMNVAQQVAKHISTSTTQFTIHPDSVEAFPNGGGFDLDHPKGEYEGGSYIVVPKEGKHKIYNAAIGNKYIGFVSPQGEVVFDGMYEAVKPDTLINKPEDSAVDEELTEAYVPSNIKDFAKRKGVSSLVNKVAGWAEKVGKIGRAHV